MQPLIAKKRVAALSYKEHRSQNNLQQLHSTRSLLQAEASRANQYWLELCQDIQKTSCTGDLLRMHDGIRKALGPNQEKTAPLDSLTGEIITDKKKQLEKWVEHYSLLFST